MRHVGGCVPIDSFIRFAAICEVLIGLGFVTGRLPRVTLLMTFAALCTAQSERDFLSRGGRASR